ncbi:GNAT family N-acetyltransferase [Pseudomonas sp. Fl5BN2]|uniref:GNAT family N-acetyltransferase n=1 Tax=Pseudomonas sp. Fl5BN2 TaxID=2697652 RepID=UPI00137740DF|nr:GNAT family N-acetyltransferase [Pseudomonas sp. Fl5BN2]NBF02995.1 GNAT family N-acetyltransferase [Pseudomonas sp. Fl5BN2]
MQPAVNPKHPGLAIRVADEGFAAYVWGSDFSFEVSAYAEAERGLAVADWPLRKIVPYRKCYGIDPEEFGSYRNAPGSEIFMAYLDDQPVGHLVVSTNWNGYGHVDELAVHVPARRHGVAKALLEVAQFWSRKKQLPGVMLETQNNNLGACRLYERCGYVVGGVDHLRYRGIDPQTGEVAIFWYRLFADEPQQATL